MIEREKMVPLYYEGVKINFNVELLKEGMCRMVNNFSETSEFAASFTQ